MSLKGKQRIFQYLIYLVLWAILFIAPVLTTLIQSSGNSHLSLSWNDVFRMWSEILPYFALFLLHNFFLAPLLVYKKKKGVYFLSASLLLILFALHLYSQEPKGIPTGMMRHDKEMFHPGHIQERGPMFDNDGPRRPPEMDEHFEFDDEYESVRPERPDFEPDRKPLFMGPMLQIGVLKLFIAILMLGMNLGVMLYFNARKNDELLVELEKKNLEQQLQYLKYQINPHFFMNTLNNIHALVDIDPEKAKTTIVELSKLMRYVLYEGDKAVISIQREIEFLKHYIALMRLRYTDKVKITVEVQDDLPHVDVPPLLFILFVENAFKHGVSYQNDSFIDVSLKATDKRLVFRCCNSKHANLNDEHGGIGLENARKRMNLIYGDNYTLTIFDEPVTYEVILDLPMDVPTNTIIEL